MDRSGDGSDRRVQQEDGKTGRKDDCSGGPGNRPPRNLPAFLLINRIEPSMRRCPPITPHRARTMQPRPWEVTG
jgi:hypothetical protein